MTEPPRVPSAAVSAPYAEPPRRGFFVKFLAGLIGTVVGLVPLAAGLAFFFDPLLRKKSAAGGDAGADDDFIRVATLDALPDDGTPQSFAVLKDRRDAWNFFRQQPVGSVFLRKMPNRQVLAFNVVCPHLGCAVDYRPAKRDFFCPCHTSAFDLDGKKTNAIPPRGMDALEVKVDDDGGIRVRFENYQGGTPEKIPV
jgi:Rieske Fe-S protein